MHYQTLVEDLLSRLSNDPANAQILDIVQDLQTRPIEDKCRQCLAALHDSLEIGDKWPHLQETTLKVWAMNAGIAKLRNGCEDCKIPIMD